MQTSQAIPAPYSQQNESHQQHMTHSTQELFRTVGAYLTAELQGSRFLLFVNADPRLANAEDFQLLTSMNLATADKYKEMCENTKNLTLFMEDLQKKCMYDTHVLLMKA